MASPVRLARGRRAREARPAAGCASGRDVSGTGAARKRRRSEAAVLARGDQVAIPCLQEVAQRGGGRASGLRRAAGRIAMLAAGARPERVAAVTAGRKMRS